MSDYCPEPTDCRLSCSTCGRLPVRPGPSGVEATSVAGGRAAAFFLAPLLLALLGALAGNGGLDQLAGALLGFSVGTVVTRSWQTGGDSHGKEQ